MTAGKPSRSESKNAISPSTDWGTDIEPIEQSPDEVFTLLKSRRRRAIIRHLAHEVDDDEAITLSELATQITARITDKAPHEVDNAKRKSVYVGLSQNHLDILAEANIISETSAGIRKGNALETVAAVIDYVDTICTTDETPQDGDHA